MKHQTPTLAAVAALALCLAGPVLAQHAERCEPIPKEQWKSKADLERKLTDMGWKIRRVKIENGCYEVYGTDERGGKVDVGVDRRDRDGSPPVRPGERLGGPAAGGRPRGRGVPPAQARRMASRGVLPVEVRR